MVTTSPALSAQVIQASCTGPSCSSGFPEASTREATRLTSAQVRIDETHRRSGDLIDEVISLVVGHAAILGRPWDARHETRPSMKGTSAFTNATLPSPGASQKASSCASSAAPAIPRA